MQEMSTHIGRGITSKVREKLIANPKLKLLEQGSEVMRLHQQTGRIEGVERAKRPERLLVESKSFLIFEFRFLIGEARSAYCVVRIAKRSQ